MSFFSALLILAFTSGSLYICLDLLGYDTSLSTDPLVWSDVIEQVIIIALMLICALFILSTIVDYFLSVSFRIKLHKMIYNNLYIIVLFAILVETLRVNYYHNELFQSLRLGVDSYCNSLMKHFPYVQ